MSERVLECVQEDIRTNTHTKAHTHTNNEFERVFVSERVLTVRARRYTNTHTKAQTHNKLLNTRTHAHTNGRSHKHAHRHIPTQPHT